MERILAKFPFSVKEDKCPVLRKKMKWTDDKFKRRIGTTKPLFILMLAILQIAYDKLHQTGGNPRGLQ